jgi:hypothetical protein
MAVEMSIDVDFELDDATYEYICLEAERLGITPEQFIVTLIENKKSGAAACDSGLEGSA